MLNVEIECRISWTCSYSNAVTYFETKESEKVFDAWNRFDENMYSCFWVIISWATSHFEFKFKMQSCDPSYLVVDSFNVKLNEMIMKWKINTTRTSQSHDTVYMSKTRSDKAQKYLLTVTSHREQFGSDLKENVHTSELQQKQKMHHLNEKIITITTMKKSAKSRHW
jgi:hypothetical protein